MDVRSNLWTGAWVVCLIACVAGCSRMHTADDFGTSGENSVAPSTGVSGRRSSDRPPTAAGSGKVDLPDRPRASAPTVSQAGAPATPRAGDAAPSGAGTRPVPPQAGVPVPPQAGVPPVPPQAGVPPVPPQAGAAPPAPAGSGVACGPARCETPQVPGIMLLPACCADPSTGTCGTMSGGACMRPPPAAPNCPIPQALGITFRACCVTSTNLCGVDASILGMGCVSISSIPGLEGQDPMTRCDGTRFGR